MRPQKQLNIKLLDLCNATCSFCGYSKDRLREKVRQGYQTYTLNVDHVISRFDEIKAKGIGILHLTGGEPTLHPRFDEFVRKARAAGFKVRTGTNGSLLTEDRVKLLCDSGIYYLWYSLDTFPFSAHLAHRGFTALTSKMEAGLEALIKQGVNVFGQTVLSRVLPVQSSGLPDLQGHMDYYLKRFGLKRFVFSYPMHRPENAVHHLATEGGEAVDYTQAELLGVLRHVLMLKDKIGPPFTVNPYVGLHQQIAEMEGRETIMGCQAGQDIFFLGSDETTLRPCYHLSHQIVDELNGKPLKPDTSLKNCRACRDQCFRDPSLMYSAFSHPLDFIRQGFETPVFLEHAFKDISDLIVHRAWSHG